MKFIGYGMLAFSIAISGACGGDDGGGGTDSDPGVDAAPNPWDTISNSILFSAAQVDLDGDTNTIESAGPAFTASFNDDAAAADGTVLHDTATLVGGCVVTKYSVGDTAANPLDEGAITLETSGGNPSPAGPYTCAFNNAEEAYVCSPDGGTGAIASGATITTGMMMGVPTVTIVDAGASWDAAQANGMYVAIDGISEVLASNSPVLNMTGTSITFVGGATPGTASSAGTYQLYVGGPGSPLPFALGEEISVSKVAGTNIPAFDVDGVDVAGSGVGMPSEVSAFPWGVSPAVDWSIGCGGTCADSADLGGVAGWIISGSTTDAGRSAVGTLNDPTSEYLTFQCRTVGTDATFEAAALDAIIGESSQDAIEIRAIRINAVLGNSAEGEPNVVGGKTFVGYTSRPSGPPGV